ncbi:MAG TPA: MFS transporter [Terriglobia bacterium]|nr:MFS transporter [Terriglobia bacterium]
MSLGAKHWDTSYEWKAVFLLGLGFGLVGLDRWIIAPLFPCMVATDTAPGCGAPGLGLSYQAIGNLVGVLGIVWGVFAAISGRISDAIGHRKILIPSIFFFSLMSGFSGMATGLASLIAIRGLMGMMEGSYCPTSFTATAAAAHPSRRGFLQGLQQSGFALFGFGLGPIIATQLLQYATWRQVFWVVAIPGFIVGALLYVVLREPKDTQGGAVVGAVSQGKGAGYGEVVKNRNIVLCMMALMCAMACIFVLGGMLPNYLVDYLKLTQSQMGFVISALGFGGFVGQFGVPGISDKLGRKPTAVLAFLGAGITVWLFMGIGATPNSLFLVLFLVSFFSLGNVALITGPIATESAPAGLISAAIGIVVASGEIFGGGIAPVIGGAIAQAQGIQNILWMPLVGVAAGALVSLFLKETAPVRVGAKVLEEVGSRKSMER